MMDCDGGSFPDWQRLAGHRPSGGHSLRVRAASGAVPEWSPETAGGPGDHHRSGHSGSGPLPGPSRSCPRRPLEARRPSPERSLRVRAAPRAVPELSPEAAGGPEAITGAVTPGPGLSRSCPRRPLGPAQSPGLDQAAEYRTLNLNMRYHGDKNIVGVWKYRYGEENAVPSVSGAR